MSMSLQSVKEKKTTSTSKIKNYNKNIRYQYTPTGWFTKNLPLLVAPLFSSTIIFILIAIVIGYLVIQNPQLMQKTSEEKGQIAAVTSFMLLAPNAFSHYLINALFVWPVAKFHKYQTSKSNYMLIAMNVMLVISIGLYFLQIHINTGQSTLVSSNTLANWFLPTWFFLSGMLCTFLYRSFNELYKRDKNGEIIMDESYYQRQERKKQKLK